MNDLRWTFASLDPTDAARLRRLLGVRLREAGFDDAIVASVELVCGELLSNVVRHAPGPVGLSIEPIGAEGVAICVEDRIGGDVGFAAARLPDEASEVGRGLWIVKTVAKSVRVEQTEGGKRIVAEVS